MKKTDTIEYDWPDIGKLEIQMQGMHSATLRLRPSERAIEEGLREAVKQAATASNSEAPSNTPEP